MANSDQWPFSKQEWEAAEKAAPQAESRWGNTKPIITPEVVELWKRYGLELSPTLVGGEKYYYETLRPQLINKHKGEHIAVSFDGLHADYHIRDTLASLKDLLASKFSTYWVTRIGEEISGGVGCA
eukprot:Phypoly_transcript_16637.p1 GENE.Phypoly_transcript_16637~~Phypoly_transcript_16637.p1  ORF type:complete len:126 (+),score=14.63 Phypoly_transcript_16637:64-441(+)